MALINMQQCSIGFGRMNLLESIDIQIHEGERISLLGRNGCGKTTMMRLINKSILPDSGIITFGKNVRTSLLPQDIPEYIRGTVLSVVADGLPPLSRDEHEHGDLADLQAVKKTLSLIDIDPDLPYGELSAGWKRRVLLGRALVGHPDVLLLDEPTNHLDIDAVLWLEDILVHYDKTVFFVTHDRSFLQRVANRIVELDRGKLFDWKCDYKTFLKRKESWLLAEEAQNAQFDKKLAAEEAWIRRGVKARRTRNEGRVKALTRMREDRAQRRSQQGNVRMALGAAGKSGDIVIQAKDITFGYPKLPLIKNFSTSIERGDKVGIIGPNGCGKSTLIRLLLKEIDPQEGTIRTGTRIDRIYFDQLRATLDPEKSIRQNVSGDSDTVEVAGSSRHVLGYLRDFLFEPDIADMKAGALSGGEKNRLLLAKFFTSSANFIIMDKPTNDLDIETIELLEELLFAYKGTLLLVSHDRMFLNNVVTSIIAFEGDGSVAKYAGGYDDWLVQRKAVPIEEQKKKETVREKKERARKLTIPERKELEELPCLIDQKENRKHEIYALMADPSFYQKPGQEIADTSAELAAIDDELNILLARWEELGSI